VTDKHLRDIHKKFHNKAEWDTNIPACAGRRIHANDTNEY
jgi:hypothetical protein